MRRRLALKVLAGAPALVALPTLPAFADVPPDAATRAAAAKIYAKYKSNPAFSLLMSKAPIQAFAQFTVPRSMATRILAYELGATGTCQTTGATGTCHQAAGATGGCLTKAKVEEANGQQNALTKAGAPIAVCALTFAGHPPANFGAQAGLPALNDAKGWRSFIAPGTP